jgi:hypothetical protein
MQKITTLLTVVVCSFIFSSEVQAFTPRAQTTTTNDCDIQSSHWRNDEIMQDQWGSYTDPYAYRDITQESEVYSKNARYVDDFAELNPPQRKIIVQANTSTVSRSSNGSAQGGGSGASSGNANIVALSSLPHTGGNEYISLVFFAAAVMSLTYIVRNRQSFSYFSA